MTHVLYFSDLSSVSVDDLNALYAWFPPQQQQIIDSMKSHIRKVEQAVAYTLLVHAIAQPLNNDFLISACGREVFSLSAPLPVDQLPLWQFGDVGKPFMTNHQGLFFNISHCRHCVAVALSDREVGIDVEGRRRFSDTLLRRSCNTAEQQLVATAPDPELEFARLWTRKEAFFKYTGTGILIPHLPNVADEAQSANCSLFTTFLNNSFWLTVAQLHLDA